MTPTGFVAACCPPIMVTRHPRLFSVSFYANEIIQGKLHRSYTSILAAKVSSNLIDLQFTTASTTWRKLQKRTKLLNVETLFKISYTQTRTCDFVESDLASHGDVFSVLYSMDQNDIKDFHHHHEYLPMVRDREMLMEAGSDIGQDSSSNGSIYQPLLDDDPAWDYLEEMTTSDEEAYDGGLF